MASNTSHDTVISVRIEQHVHKQLARTAHKYRTNKSQLLRLAIEKLIKEGECGLTPIVENKSK